MDDRRSSLRARLAPRIGTILAIALALPVVGVLLSEHELRASAIVVPLVYAGAVLVFAVIALFQASHPVIARPRNALLGCLGFLAFAAMLYFDVPYGVAVTVLIAVAFAIIGRRSWRVTILFWLGTLGLAYGVFRALLGVPIH
jgi:hypothetical protein